MSESNEKQKKEPPKKAPNPVAERRAARDAEVEKARGEDTSKNTGTLIVGLESTKEMYEARGDTRNIVVADSSLDAHLKDDVSQQQAEQQSSMAKRRDRKKKTENMQSVDAMYSELNNTEDFLAKGNFHTETFIVVINGEPQVRDFVVR